MEDAPELIFPTSSPLSPTSPPTTSAPAGMDASAVAYPSRANRTDTTAPSPSRSLESAPPAIEPSAGHHLAPVDSGDHLSSSGASVETKSAKSHYVLLEEADEDDSPPSNSNISKITPEVLKDVIEDTSSKLNPFSMGPVDDDAPNVPQSFTLIAEAKFQVPVEVIFNLLMSDSAFAFLHDFHKKCGDKDLSFSNWRKDENGGLVRDVAFLHPIKVFLGFKFGRCQEVQRLCVYKNRHLVMRTSQKISDAPIVNHLTVEGLWDVKEDEDMNNCNLRIYIDLTFSEETIFRETDAGIQPLKIWLCIKSREWYKGKIEESTKKECKQVFGHWINLSHDVLKLEESYDPLKQDPASHGNWVRRGIKRQKLLVNGDPEGPTETEHK